MKFIYKYSYQCYQMSFFFVFFEKINILEYFLKLLMCDIIFTNAIITLFSLHRGRSVTS